ncbi:MAG: hypothetical protein WB696_12235 [Chthoniobacterales bacterium]
MIGVAVRADERDIVAEFFELFKTLWEFCRSGVRYDVVLCTSVDYRCEASRLLLVLGGAATAFDTERRRKVKSRPPGFIVSDEGKRVPIYEAMVTFPGCINCVLTEEATGEPVAVFEQRGEVTTLRVGYNIFAEARFLLTAGQPACNAGMATLEIHIEFLRNWITRSGIASVEIPPVPDGHNFIACLTHDIDHPAVRNHRFDHTMLGFLYRSTIGTLLSVCRGKKPVRALWKNWGAACMLPFVQIGIAKDFWSGFDRYLEIENGLGSTFFVIPRSNYAGRTTDGLAPALRASRYDLGQLLPQLKRIVAAGREVGVHGVDAWLDANEGRKERARVSEALGTTELGVRMHWLFFNKDSPAMLDQAGYTYDSTFGYRETAGYRAGTTQTYQPLGVTNLLELPLHVMDTALFYPSYLNLDDEEARRLVWRLIDDVEHFGGVLTINWHDRSIAPERLWGDFYRDLVRELKMRRAWLPNSAQAVAWFRHRRAARLESIRLEGGVMKVRGQTDGGDTLPGLKIRVFKPRARSLSEHVEARKAAEFVEIRFDRATDFDFAI